MAVLREEMPVLFGVRVAGDDVQVVYRGDGALFDAPGLCAHPDDEAALHASLRDAARAALPWRFTWRVGRTRIEGVAHPLPGADGEMTLHGYLREVGAMTDDALRFRSI